jgi:LysR family transcriptional regulator, carnitine catabolism transcriptional activator
MEVDQLATVMGMVRAGLGISVVPSLTLFHFQHPEIVTRPLSWPGLTRKIYLVRRRDRGLSLAAQSLHDLVVKRKPVPDAAQTGGRRKARARISAA